MAIVTDEPEGGPQPGALLKAVPGRARPRADVLAEFTAWADAQRKRLKPALWALFIPRVEDQFRWRVQLDCGCTPEVLTSGRDQFPDGRAYYDPIGQAYLPLGEMWCDTDHEAPTPYRDIVAWRTGQSTSSPLILRRTRTAWARRSGRRSGTPNHIPPLPGG